MIPIIAIANLLNGLIAALITVLLIARKYAKHIQGKLSRGVAYFIAFYFTVSVMWLLYATPGLMVTNLVIIALLQLSADLLIYLASIITIQISFIALNRYNASAVPSLIIATAGIIYILGSFISFAPHIKEVIPPYVYWHPGTAPWLHIMTGAIVSISALFFMGTFATLGFKKREIRPVYTRSLYLAGGMLAFFLASAAFFIFATGGFILTLSASILGIIGLLLMLAGIHTDMSVPHENNDHPVGEISTTPTI